MAALRKRNRSTSQSSCAEESELDLVKRPKLQDGDFICPICFEILSEVYVTVCGHSFCYRCITPHLRKSPSCPVCKFNLPPQNSIHPNFSLNDVVTKYRQQQASVQARTKTSAKLQDIAGLIDKVDQKDYPELLSFLEAFKQDCQEQALSERHHLLLDFLESASDQKARELEALKAQHQVICSDLESIKNRKVEAQPNLELLAQKKLRVHSNFNELVDDYISIRLPQLHEAEETGLQRFSDTLDRFTSYSSWRELSSLTYGDQSTPCSIVSSIEFDRDREVFAVAGVTKKIKVFNYASILKNVGFHNHYPLHEMECDAKLSSVCFNPYHKATLASADYEGCVCVWDINTASRQTCHNEHNKRVWSVVYNPTEPTLYASGSDDSTVKLWCANRQQSIFTLDTKANVCSVQFHPLNRYYLAFGSADHSIHYMDLRNPRSPLHLLKGHRKAVSYVLFISNSEVVSASTDSELKLWNIDSGECKRTYKGHVNEKNFVGLTVSSDYIACGSENNSVYVYSKQISKPMLTYRFNVPNTLLADSGGHLEQTESTDFVSSVCWKKGLDVILAANSQGHIKVLEMC